MRKLKIVFLETYRKNVQSKAFLTMIFLPIILVVVFGAVGYFIGKSTASEDVIQVVIKEATFKESVPTKLGKYSVAVVNEKQAQKALKNKKSQAYVVLGKTGQNVTAQLVTKDGELGVTEEASVKALVQTYVDQLQTALTAERLKIAPETLTQLQKSVAMTEKVVGQGQDTTGTKKAIQTIFATVICVLVFFCVVNYSALIAQEIASEKGTRIMEIILSSVSAKKHFYGKLLGILAVCLTQIVIYAVIGIVSFQAFKTQSFVADFMNSFKLSELVGKTFYVNILFGIIGLIGYIALASLFGSAVSRTEDVNKAVQPLMFISIGAFYLGIFLQYTPENIALKIGSFVPLFATFTMPFRVAAETASNWEIVVSLMISIVGTVLLLLVSASIYQSNVLIYGEGTIWQNLRKAIALRKTERAI